MTPITVQAFALDRDDPDRWASLADLRALACIRAGADLDDIDPATGHELTRRAYLVSRASWVEYVATHGLNDYTRPACRAARDYWAERRPGYLVECPWPVV